MLGAARYLQWLDQQLPDSLHAKDRIWFTLAAYNVGMGHLEDALPLLEMSLDDADRPLFDALVHPGNVVSDFHNSNPWMKARI